MRKGRKLERGAKAQAIREAFQSLGIRTRPVDIISAVGAQGITVSSAAVVAVRKQLKKKRRLDKKAARLAAPAAAPEVRAPVSEAFSFEHLLEAKKLAEQLGGIEAARQALTALASLQ